MRVRQRSCRGSRWIVDRCRHHRRWLAKSKQNVRITFNESESQFWTIHRYVMSPLSSGQQWWWWWWWIWCGQPSSSEWFFLNKSEYGGRPFAFRNLHLHLGWVPFVPFTQKNDELQMVNDTNKSDHDSHCCWYANVCKSLDLQKLMNNKTECIASNA